MKMLVLGGTGAMGRPMTDILCSDPSNEVYYVSRKPSSFKYENIHHIQGDVFDDECFDKAFQDSYYDCAVDFLIYSPEMRRKRIERILGGVGHYICTSSASVYEGGHFINTEETPRWIDSYSDNEKRQYERYHVSKAVDEDIITSSKHKNWTIVRPSNTWSETKIGLYTWPVEVFLWRYFNDKAICIPEEVLDHQFTVTYGPDVAKAISLLICKEGACGQVFNICATDNVVSYRELIDLYNNIFALHNKHMLKIHYVKASDIYEFIPWEKDLWIKDRMFERRVCSAEKYECFTGHKVNWLSVEKLLKRCVDSFLSSNKVIKPEPMRNAVMDRLTNESTSLNCFDNSHDKIKYFLYRYKLLNSVILHYQRLKGKNKF